VSVECHWVLATRIAVCRYRILAARVSVECHWVLAARVSVYGHSGAIANNRVNRDRSSGGMRPAGQGYRRNYDKTETYSECYVTKGIVHGFRTPLSNVVWLGDSVIMCPRRVLWQVTAVTRRVRNLQRAQPGYGQSLQHLQVSAAQHCGLCTDFCAR